jgi:uncharacterized protein YqjF (DUF2071 family)
MFDYDILNVTTHRPWPMPAAPWVMTQTWHDLLFAHWPVDGAALRERIPSGFELDEFKGQAWIGIVPFRMANVTPRGVPAYFFSLDATNPVAVVVARTFAHLPYYWAAMSLTEQNGWIQYDSRRTSSSGPARFVGRYRPIGAANSPIEGTLEYFLTERYCLFTLDSGFHACRLDIHHPPWPLQDAEAQIDVNTMAEASGIRLPGSAPLLHFSRRQDMVAWMPKRL